MIFTDDSEAEDDKILPKDNLILVGHVDDDSVCMEVYGELCNHHDLQQVTLILPSFQSGTNPRDPSTSTTTSSFPATPCASSG